MVSRGGSLRVTEEHVELYKKAYDRNYFAQYEDRALENWQKRCQMYLIERNMILKYCDAGKILDVGCGVGGFLEAFDERRWERYGYEISEYAKTVAAGKGIRFEFEWERQVFDVVTFRGCLHHLDTPFFLIKRAIKSLRMHGVIAFLMTPNYGGLMYRLFGEIPGTDDCAVFLMPTETMLRQTLRNFGCEVLEFSFPYRGTPYANIPKDLFNFALKFLGSKRQVPFWGNYMECVARKVRDM